MNWREVDFEVRNWTRMAHAHAEALLKLQVCRWIDFSNKKYYITLLHFTLSPAGNFFAALYHKL